MRTQVRRGRLLQGRHVGVFIQLSKELLTGQPRVWMHPLVLDVTQRDPMPSHPEVCAVSVAASAWCGACQLDFEARQLGADISRQVAAEFPFRFEWLSEYILPVYLF